MEITLEKIELVKDKTGVTYKEAKEALEKANGDTVEAIILLEDMVNENETSDSFSKVVVDKVKELVKKGNVSKICVKKDDEIVANIPINAGIVGAIIAPWGVVAAAVAAFGFRCSIEITTNDGELIDVTEKIKDTASNVKEKGNVAFDYAKEKAPEVWDFAKEKGTDAINFAKEKAPEVWDKAKEKGADAINFAKEKAPEVWDFAKEKGTDAINFAKDKAPEVWDKAKEKGADAWDKAKEKGTDAWDKAKIKLEERKQAGGSDLFQDIDLDDEDISSLLNDEDK